MTTMDRFEAGLPDLLSDLGRADASELIRDVLAVTTTMPQRGRRRARLAAAVASIDEWSVFRRLPTPLRVAIAVALLLLAAAAAAVMVGGLRSVPTLRTTLVSAGTIPGSFTSPIVVVLTDGRLLIGGYGGDASIAWIFDPVTRTSVGVDSGLPSVDLLGASLLEDGRVFLLGWQNTVPVADGRSIAWVLDPSSGRLSPPAPTLHPRFYPSVVALTDGTVLVSGGLANQESTTTYASSERFDPVSGSFTMGPAIASPRFGQSATSLPGGDILFAGGSNVDPKDVGLPLLTIERFDPRTGSTRTVGSLGGVGRGEPILVSLPDRRVLIIPPMAADRCGRHGINPVTPLIFDPATEATKAAPDLPHAAQTAVGLGDGRVVVAGQWTAIPGGCGSADNQYVTDAWLGIYDPITGATVESPNPITGTGTLPVDPTLPYAAGALLPDGRVALITEDLVNANPDTVELLTVAPR